MTTHVTAVKKITGLFARLYELTYGHFKWFISTGGLTSEFLHGFHGVNPNNRFATKRAVVMNFDVHWRRVQLFLREVLWGAKLNRQNAVANIHFVIQFNLGTIWYFPLFYIHYHILSYTTTKENTNSYQG